MVRCPQCGTESAQDANFCGQCGQRLRDPGMSETFAGMAPVTGEIERPNFSEIDPHTIAALAPGSALLVVLSGPGAGGRYLLDTAVVKAGRHPDSDVFLDDVTVSRHHVEFRRTSEGYHLYDVGSLNGTYVNREPVDVATLAGGDEVQIGKFRLVYLTGPRTGEPAAR